MGRPKNSPDRHLRDQHTKLIRYASYVSRNQTCQHCGKKLHTAILDGDGLTLTELSRERRATLNAIQRAIGKRGWTCRSCRYHIRKCQISVQDLVVLEEQEASAVETLKANRGPSGSNPVDFLSRMRGELNTTTTRAKAKSRDADG